MSDLLVVGDCCADVVVSGPDVTPVFGDVESIVDSGRLTIGGSSTITACGAARLGLDVALVSRLGADPLGDFLAGAVRNRGVNVDAIVRDPQIATGMSVILVRPGDRAILTALGTIDQVRVADVPPSVLARARHVHVGAYYLQSTLRPDLPEFLRAARAAGVSTSVDPNWDPAGRWDGIDELLDVTDFLFLNAAEAEALTGSTEVATATERLSRGGAAVIVKQGERGVTARREGALVHVPAPEVEAVDPVGAGDSFTAGFLRAHLNGEPWEFALALGCACGALSTRDVGGTTSQPRLEEASAVARRLPPG
ncbi:MAG TPA: sugar kinase [Mycobacteriales bacterium]|nr:sugar kinase [Mycobacteriales bacterium]